MTHSEAVRHVSAHVRTGKPLPIMDAAVKAAAVQRVKTDFDNHSKKPPEWKQRLDQL